MTVASAHPKVVVTSSLNFWRAHENSEIKAVSDDLLAARNEKGDSLVISGAFYQEPQKAKMGRFLGSLAKIAAPLAAGGALLALGVAAAPVGILAGALALTSVVAAGASRNQLQNSLADYQQAKSSGAPEGLDLWRDGGPDLTLPVGKGSPPEDGLRELLKANMRDFPQSLHVVHANGHGVGAKYNAGLSGESFADSVNEAARSSGRPVDVLLLESCLGANLEQLARFESSVKYVVGYEDAIPTSAAASGRVPLRKMISEAVDESSARDVALEMAQLSADHFDLPGDDAIASVPLRDRLQPEHLDKIKLGTDSTSVAIDMEAFREVLRPAMDSLGSQLSKLLERQPDFATHIASAREEAQLIQGGGLIDLGLFLQGLSRGVAGESPAGKALDSVLQGLEQTLLAKRTGETYPLSGLSVHTSAKARDSQAISQPASAPFGDHLPAGWSRFVQTAF